MPKTAPTAAMVTRKPGRGTTSLTAKAAAAAISPAARGFSQAQLYGQKPRRRLTASMVAVFSVVIAEAMPRAAPSIPRLGTRAKLTASPVTAAEAVATMATFWLPVIASIRGVGPTEEL